MNPATSLYLDLFRFGLAFEVFLSHYCSGRLSGGLFWQLGGNLGHLAVIGFFVLSGLVIAYSVEVKDTTLHSYCVSRLSRLYSVVLPAVLLTLVVDAIGSRISPALYTEDWGFTDSYPLLRALLAVTFTSHLWFYNFQVFSNGPFWSLPYEFWYYVFFGAICFLSGRARLVAAALAMIIAGPRILFFLPIWMLGVGAYRVMSTVQIGRPIGWLMFSASILLVLACEYFRLPDRSLEFAEGTFSDATIKLLCQVSWTPYDYVFGLLVAVNIIGFHSIHEAFEGFLLRFRTPIRWLAGLTFSLYLFHLPLLQFYAAISPWPETDKWHRSLLIFLPLATVAILGSLTERRRYKLRRYLAKVIPDESRWPFIGSRHGVTR